MVGLEPTNDGVKVHCLSTWLHPNNKKKEKFFFAKNMVIIQIMIFG